MIKITFLFFYWSLPLVWTRGFIKVIKYVYGIHVLKVFKSNAHRSVDSRAGFRCWKVFFIFNKIHHSRKVYSRHMTYQKIDQPGKCIEVAQSSIKDYGFSWCRNFLERNMQEAKGFWFLTVGEPFKEYLINCFIDLHTCIVVFVWHQHLRQKKLTIRIYWLTLSHNS